MKEKIEAKIAEIIEHIISKDVTDISYNEYRILDAKLGVLKWEEEQRTKNKELTELMVKTIGGGICSPAPITNLKEE